MKVHGHCHCGSVKYEADVDPAKAQVCHCTDCQTLSGAPFRSRSRPPATVQDRVRHAQGLRQDRRKRKQASTGVLRQLWVADLFVVDRCRAARVLAARGLPGRARGVAAAPADLVHLRDGLGAGPHRPAAGRAAVASTARIVHNECPLRSWMLRSARCRHGRNRMNTRPLAFVLVLAAVAAHAQTTGPAPGTATPQPVSTAPAPRGEPRPSDTDPRVCLEFATNNQVIACAERFRPRRAVAKT